MITLTVIVSDTIGYILGGVILIPFIALLIYAIKEQSESASSHAKPSKRKENKRQEKINRVKTLRYVYPDAYMEWFGDGSYLQGLTENELDSRLLISENDWKAKQLEYDLKKKKQQEEQYRQYLEEQQRIERIKESISRAQTLYSKYPNVIRERFKTDDVSNLDLAQQILAIPVKEYEEREEAIRIQYENIRARYPHALKQIEDWRWDKEPIYDIYLGGEQNNIYKHVYSMRYPIIAIPEHVFQKYERRCLEREKRINHCKTQEQFYKEFRQWATQDRIPATGYLAEYTGIGLTGMEEKYSIRVLHFYNTGFCSSDDIDYEYFPKFKVNRDTVESVKNGTEQISAEYYSQFLHILERIRGSVRVVIADGGLGSELERRQLESLINTLQERKIPYCSIEQMEQTLIGSDYIVLFGIVMTKDKTKSQCEFLLKRIEVSNQILLSYSVFLDYGADYAKTLKEHKEYQLKRLEEKKEKERQEEERRRKAEDERKRQEAQKAERERREKEENIRRERQLTDTISSKVRGWESLPNDALKINYLLDYYPTTVDFDANEIEWDARWLVWNFKNNPEKTTLQAHERALNVVIPRFKELLANTFGETILKSLTLVCIPASTKSLNDLRYKDFSERFCYETGIENAMQYTYVLRDKTAKHEGGEDENVNYSFDNSFFKGKRVILLDDIITKGNSMRIAKSKLEKLGATVICGIAVGKTRHERRV